MSFQHIKSNQWPGGDNSFDWRLLHGVCPIRGSWSRGFCIYPKQQDSPVVFILTQAGTGQGSPQFARFWPALVDRLVNLECTFRACRRAFNGLPHRQGLAKEWGEGGPSLAVGEVLATCLRNCSGSQKKPSNSFSRILKVQSPRFQGLSALAVTNLIASQ